MQVRGWCAWPVVERLPRAVQEAGEAEELAQQQGAPQRLRARVRVKTLAMWTDQGRLGQELCRVRSHACHCLTARMAAYALHGY